LIKIFIKGPNLILLPINRRICNLAVIEEKPNRLTEDFLQLSTIPHHLLLLPIGRSFASDRKIKK